MMIASTALMTLPCYALSSAAQADPWQIMHDGAEAWHNLDFGGDVAFVAGDTSGAKFEHAVGKNDMRYNEISGASFTKFCSVLMMTNMVKNGVMSFDDPIRKYVKWWEQNPSEPLYNATLRHALSFTTGFHHDICYGEDKPEESCDCYDGYDACAEKMYKDYMKNYTVYKPNTTWSYLSIHLQMAGAMAIAAAKEHYKIDKINMEGLVSYFLFQPFDMQYSSFQPSYFPSMATGFYGPGMDIHNMLRKVLNYEVIPKHLMDQVEFDYSWLVTEGAKGSTDGWWGHYGMGNWVECLGYGIAPKVNNKLDIKPRCKALHIRSAPGGSGVYPLWDRSTGGGLAGPTRNESYFATLVDEPDALSGIPEYFRIMAKPVADYIIGGHDLTKVSDQDLLQNLGGLIHRDIAYIKQTLKNCTCEHQTNKDEPYASLYEGILPEDTTMNRNDILQKPNSGVTLRRFINVSKTLGRCICAGRSGKKQDLGKANHKWGYTPKHHSFNRQKTNKRSGRTVSFKEYLKARHHRSSA